MTARNYFNHAGYSIITARIKRAVVAQLEREAQLGSFIADQAAVTERQTLL